MTLNEARSMFDTTMLDWLQEQLDKQQYTGKCVFRWSDTGRGWRLHETSREDGSSTVREALRRAMMEQLNESE